MYNLDNEQAYELRQALLAMGDAAVVIAELAEARNSPDLIALAAEVKTLTSKETHTGQAIAKA